MARRLTPRRAAAWCAVVLAVVLGHGLATHEFRVLRDAAQHADAPPPRIEVAFVRELQPAEPPPVPAPRPRRAAKPVPKPAPALPASAPEPAVSAVADAASAPDAAGPAASDPVLAAAAASALASEPPAAAEGAASEPASAADPAFSTASAPGAPGFEWPPSTRLSYSLTGWWRGELHGSARVQWVRLGLRYQVHLDVDVALVVSRRMTSDGELTAEGLKPRRYDEETRVLGSETRRATLHFEPDRIVNAAGVPRALPPGVQDTASQFVQLTWLFTTQPQLLEPGRSIELPLALPRSSKAIVFDVIGREPLDTPLGRLDTVHLKPRVEQTAKKPAGNDISAEIWFAPGLQYLPVRIRLTQGEISADLVIATPPLQAGP